MIPQVFHYVEDCPACGCAVEIPAECVEGRTVCGHCSEPFWVFGMDDQPLSAAIHKTIGSATRGDLADEHSVATNNHSRRAVPQWHTDAAGRTWVYPPCSRPQLFHVSSFIQDYTAIAPWSSPVVVVEHRDEVFARIAGDLAEAGSRVVRAETTDEVIRLSEVYQPHLIVANTDLPDQSGWLMVSKLRLRSLGIRIWLYQPKSTEFDQGMAQFLQVDELLAYGGNLLRLSEMIMSLIFQRPDPMSMAQKPVDPVELVAV